MTAAFGSLSSPAKFPLRVSTILLESAAIDIPVAILACVCLVMRRVYAEAVIEIMVPTQVR
jgi:hypothetical protein